MIGRLFGRAVEWMFFTVLGDEEELLAATLALWATWGDVDVDA